MWLNAWRTRTSLNGRVLAVEEEVIGAEVASGQTHLLREFRISGDDLVVCGLQLLTGHAVNFARLVSGEHGFGTCRDLNDALDPRTIRFLCRSG
jgi:hypothetical protein